MNRSSEASESVQKGKPRIRRHRILALVIPFAVAITFFTLFYGIQAVRMPCGYEENPNVWFRFWDGVRFGFPFSAIALIAFVEDWRRLGGEYWLSYPFYVIPAVWFFFTKKTVSVIVAYTVYCLLVGMAAFSGIRLLVWLTP